MVAPMRFQWVAVVGISAISAVAAIFYLVALTTPELFFDRTVLGTMLGGAIAAGGAAFAVYLQIAHSEEREATRIRHAVWVDLKLTVRPVFEEYEFWNNKNLLLGETFAAREVAQLHASTFDKVRDKIGILTQEQLMLLILVHDNLASAREMITKFTHKQPDPMRRMSILRGDLSNEIVLGAENKRRQEIADLLVSILCDIRDALRALDPNKLYQSEFEQILKRYWEPDVDPKWYARCEALYQTRDEAAKTAMRRPST